VITKIMTKKRTTLHVGLKDFKRYNIDLKDLKLTILNNFIFLKSVHRF